MATVEDDSLVVIRFSPWTATGMQKALERQVTRDRLEGRRPRQGISVFATRLEAGETVDEAVSRLADEVKDHAGGERLAVTTEHSLGQDGYRLHRNEPPPGHYLVGVENLEDTPELSGLSDNFARDVRKNPANRRS